MKKGDPTRGYVHRVPPAKPRPLRHLRVVVSEDGKALVEVYVPAAPVAACLPALAAEVPATARDLAAALDACRSPGGMVTGAAAALEAVLRGHPGWHARTRLAAALVDAGAAVVRIGRQCGAVHVSVHPDHAKPPRDRTLDLALAASRSGCPVVVALDGRAARVAKEMARERVAMVTAAEPEKVET